MTLWIKNPLALFDGTEVVNCAGIVIRGNRIVEIPGAGQIPESRVDEVWDASGHVITPGLINTHHHYYQTLTRACPPALNKGLFAWLRSLYPIWSGLKPELVELSTRLASAELLLSGCTTSADHHYLFTDAIPDAVDLQVEANRKLGMRFVATRGSMSLGESAGGLPPETTIQDEDTILEDSARVVDKFHDPDEGSMVQVALAPCSPFSVSRSLMEQTANLGRDRDVRLHTHLAETRDELDFCQRNFGCSPVEYLEDVGWMEDRTWLAHGIFFSAEEKQRLGQAGVGIAHCPGSNMMLGSGTCDVMQLDASGCPVGLAVDGSASNDSSNMIQEVRQAFLLHRLQYGASAFSHLNALSMATTGSARCLGRSDIGSIRIDACADLAMYRLDELRFSGAGDPVAALVLCHAHRADRVMVNGHWVVTDGELVNDDTQVLREQHGRAASDLLKNL